MSKEISETVAYKPGDIIVKEKSVCEFIYIVKSGQLQAFKTNSRGERITLGIINSGEYIGEMSFLLNNVHANSVAALTDVTLAKIPRNYCDKFLKTLPKWFLVMIQGQAYRLSRANEILRRNDLFDDTLSSSVNAILNKSE